jgi:hypothetical protein
MMLFRVEQKYIRLIAFMPGQEVSTGRKEYYRCSHCRKVIELRSLWRICLLCIGSGCYPLFVAGLIKALLKPNESVGVLLIWGFAVISMGSFPLVLLIEIVTRRNYPPG